MDDVIFTFMGYDGQQGSCRQFEDGSYWLIFGAMIYEAASKEELRNLVAWCLCPVTFDRPEHLE